MQIRVLGCSGAIAAGCRTTSFLLDDDVLIDAGTGVGDLRADELARIDHVLLSHSHLDHVLAVGLLADTVARCRAAAARPPVQVHALAPTLQALRTHILNDVIWPDFTRLPTPAQPALQLVPIEHGQRLDLAGRTVEVLPAAHTVPACGFAVQGKTGWWVYGGDSGPNPALWARLAQLPVATLVIETTFADDQIELARVSRHLCPRLLHEELARLPAGVDVYLTHLKPGELDAVLTQVEAQHERHHIRPLEVGQRMQLG